MDLFELTGGSEQHPVYQAMASANDDRHYGFMFSAVQAAVTLGRPLLSQSLIKAINFHAIVGLHHEAGQYRSHEVSVGTYSPPPRFRVEPLMDDLVNELNWRWQSASAVELAAYALWRINSIHPFVNGNGRTARAVCYFILCVKLGGLLPGRTIFPERLRQEPMRSNLYVPFLQRADQGDFVPLTNLIRALFVEQINDVPPV